MKIMAVLTTTALLLGACSSSSDSTDATTTTAAAGDGEAASVTFSAPEDGATVPLEVDATFLAEGIEIEPAGDVRPDAGHFHVAIDEGCVPEGEVIPKDDTHVHFGSGASNGRLTLSPGEHQLCLQVGDGAHTATALTHEITVTADDSLPYVHLGFAGGEAPTTSPFTVEMTATNFTIEPAGEVVDGAGHFHVMVDSDCVAEGEVIPKDDQHVHFGKGDTTAELTLEPGTHTLCLQVGDGAHTATALTHQVSVTIA